MTKVTGKETLELARAVSGVLQLVASGTFPTELLDRLNNDPWQLLRPGEVWETQHGTLIPKNVDLDTVQVLKDVEGKPVVVGIRNDGRFWSEHGCDPRDILIDQSEGNPFLTGRNGAGCFVDGDGNLRNLAGTVLATTVLSRNPLIARSGELVKTEEGACVFGNSVAFINAVRTGESLTVWTVHGGIYHRGTLSTPWDCLGSFPYSPGQTLHAAMKCDDTAAIVFRFDDANPHYHLVVMRSGRILVQTRCDHRHISAPVITDAGVVYVRVDDQLMQIDVSRALAMRPMGAVTGDPVVIQFAASLSRDKVRALCPAGTMVLDERGVATVIPHVPPIAVHEPYLVFHRSDSHLEISEYVGESIVSLKVQEGATLEEFLVTKDGFRIMTLTKAHPGEKCHRWLTAMIREGDDRPVFREISAPEDYTFDLQQVIITSTHNQVFAVAKRLGDETKMWRVVTNGFKTSSVRDVGRASHGIFQLRFDGPLLRWFRRDGREVDDCRMYLGH